MRTAKGSSTYVVPNKAVLPGQKCTVCTSSVAESNALGDLALVQQIETHDGNCYVSYTHIECVQNLVNPLATSWTEFDRLQEEYRSRV